MIAPYAGKFLWIWEVDSTLKGNIQAIIAQGHSLGLTGFIIKAHDGTTVWPQFAQVVQPLLQAGFMVAAWGYVYGNNPVGEAMAAQTAIDLGARFYVIDAETQYEGKSGAAKTFGDALRTKNPHLTIGYAPFAFPSLHPTFPYEAFSAFCDVCLPQMYWADFAQSVSQTVNTSYSELAIYKLPLAPIGQAYGAATGSEIAQFAALLKSRGADGVSFWDAQSANSQQLQAIRQIGHFAPVNINTPQTRGGSSLPTPNTVTLPADVQSNDWFYGAVKDLLALKIVTAYQDGLFKPEESITRAQAADWLNRLRNYLEQNPAIKS